MDSFRSFVGCSDVVRATQIDSTGIQLHLNHLDQAREQISREPLPLPVLKLDQSIADIDAFTFEHIEIIGYEHHPHISAPISV